MVKEVMAKGGGITVADQRTVFNTIRRTTDSQEAVARRQKKIIFTLIGMLFLAMGALKILGSSPVAPQGAVPVSVNNTASR